jgi:hypothetical protein
VLNLSSPARKAIAGALLCPTLSRTRQHHEQFHRMYLPAPLGSGHALQCLPAITQRSTPTAPAPTPAAPSAPRPAASARTGATAATNVTRTVIRKVHGEFATIRPLCASAGTLWVDHAFKGTQQQSPGYHETEHMLDLFLDNSMPILLSDTVPLIEGTYNALLMWHELNKPDERLQWSLLSLMPDPQVGRKDPLNAMYLWDVKFHLYLKAILPWHPELPAESLPFDSTA